MNDRKTPVYRLFAPHFESLCLILAQKLDTSFSLLHDFCQLIQTAPKAFLTSPPITRVFLACAVMERRTDIIQQLAVYAEMNAVKMIVLNADCIFAPLYLASPSKLQEGTAFLAGLFKQNNVGLTMQQLVESTLSTLIFEIIIRADAISAGEEQVIPLSVPY